MPLQLSPELFAVSLLLVLGVLLWRRTGQIAQELTELNRDLKKALDKSKPQPSLTPSPPKASSNLKDAAKSEGAILTQINAALEDKFNKLYQQFGHDTDEIKQAIRMLKASQSSAGATEPNGNSAVKKSPQQTIERSYTADLVRTYNENLDRFQAEYSPKSAHFESQESPNLTEHAAGSFFVIEGSDGYWYAMPRRRTITPTLHENVGLQRLFRYTGYESNGPDTPFSVEEPATLTAATAGSGWSVRQPGELRLKAASRG